MKKCNKIFSVLFMIICLICIVNVVEATTITSSAASVEKGKSVTITVTVPNVHTVDLTATVSGAGTSGTIRLVDGSLTGEAKSYSKSITVTPTSAGTITVSVSAGSNAVLNGEYVNVSATKTITVTEPPVVVQPQNPAPAPSTPAPTTPSNNKPATNNTNTNANTNANKKSSNANLKSMILSVEGLSPAFAKNITNYSLNVGKNVNEIKVTASVEHSRATYSVSGNTNLKEGENVVKVKVTAEDGTVKTYTINVLKSDDPIKSDATLSSLIIEDVDLGQAFDPNITEYNAGDISVKADKLNIYAYTTSDNAKIEIIGNEDLKVGENKITIKVTSENGKVVKEYTVTFNKLYSEDKVVDIYGDSLRKTENKPSLWDNIVFFYYNNLKPNIIVLILYLFIWIEFAQVVYLYKRLKKYEDVDKLTIERKVKDKKIKEKKIKEKVERPRREKVNPIFPDEE